MQGIRSPQEIGFYVGRTARLVEEYLAVLREAQADDIEQLHQTYYQERNRPKTGDVVWQTTKDDGQRPTYGKRTESYGLQTVILPLIRPEDVDRRTSYKKGDRNSDYRHRDARDIEQMVRLLRSAKEQGGLLSGAELSVLMNRSLTTIVKSLRAYFERTGDILPMKGYVPDQGSNLSHKGIDVPPPQSDPFRILANGSKEGMMKGKKYAAEQIVAKLREAEVLLGKRLALGEVRPQLEITDVTYYRWKKECGGLRIDQAKRLKELEAENGRLKKAVSDLTLDNMIPKEVSRRNF